jgi:hypothetical protein
MMDDILEAVIDLFVELFVWERLNRKLKKKIPNRFLRWAVEVLIYLTALTVLLLLIVGIYLLIKK